MRSSPLCSARIWYLAALRLCLLELDVFGMAVGLRCYQCLSLDAKSENKYINEADSSKRSESCEKFDTSSLYQITCPPEDGEINVRSRCSMFRGQATGKKLGNSYNMRIVKRDCVSVSASVGDGCHAHTLTDESIMSGVTDIVSQDGTICYCSADFCDASACPYFYLHVSFIGSRGACVNAWIIISVSVVALLVLVALVLTGYCCCCRR